MDDRIRGIREEILSRDYFDKIISRLALEPPNTAPLKHEALVQQMMKQTEITTKQREADTFQVTYSGRDPKEVRDVTNLLAGIFIEDSLSNKAGEAGSAVEFLQGQLEVYRKKLEESEAALRQFDGKICRPAPLEPRGAALPGRAAAGDADRGAEQPAPGEDAAGPAPPAGAAGGQPAPGGDGGAGAVMVANPLQAQLSEKEAQLRRLLVDYSETYPDVAR